MLTYTDTVNHQAFLCIPAHVTNKTFKPLDNTEKVREVLSLLLQNV